MLALWGVLEPQSLSLGSQTGSQQSQASSDVWLRPPRVRADNAISGLMQRSPATLQKCLLSSRSRVRVALGARPYLAGQAPPSWLFGPDIEAAMPVTCPIRARLGDARRCARGPAVRGSGSS